MIVRCLYHGFICMCCLSLIDYSFTMATPLLYGMLNIFSKKKTLIFQKRIKHIINICSNKHPKIMNTTPQNHQQHLPTILNKQLKSLTSSEIIQQIINNTSTNINKHRTIIKKTPRRHKKHIPKSLNYSP